MTISEEILAKPEQVQMCLKALVVDLILESQDLVWEQSIGAGVLTFWKMVNEENDAGLTEAIVAERIIGRMRRDPVWWGRILDLVESSVGRVKLGG